jgi:DNA-binding XRE family transcriptional regulator
MAKHAADPRKLSGAKLGRGRSPPEVSSSSTSAAGSRSTGPDPVILAKEEKVREEFQQVFGKNLRAARLKASLKQSEVAVLTGLTQQYLSLIEAGQQNITLKTMILLAEVVDSDLLDMLKRALNDPGLK